jgi:hypothetical protein
MAESTRRISIACGRNGEKFDAYEVVANRRTGKSSADNLKPV